MVSDNGCRNIDGGTRALASPSIDAQSSFDVVAGNLRLLRALGVSVGDIDVNSAGEVGSDRRCSLSCIDCGFNCSVMLDFGNSTVKSKRDSIDVCASDFKVKTPVGLGACGRDFHEVRSNLVEIGVGAGRGDEGGESERSSHKIFLIINRSP